MTKDEIKFRLSQKGASSTDIARMLNVSRVSVHNVIKGISESRRIKSTIADVLGIDIDSIWPPKKPRKTFTELDLVLAASERAGLDMDIAAA